MNVIKLKKAIKRWFHNAPNTFCRFRCVFVSFFVKIKKKTF
jgi:hypothetical protein